MGAPAKFLPRLGLTPLALATLITVILHLPAIAQTPGATWERIDGGNLISVVPPETFPPVNNPQFISAEEADRIMKPDEPVLGVFDGRVAKAYSLWHLDRHEVVNDTTPSFGPIAVTW